MKKKLIITLLLLASVHGNAQVLEQDSLALVALYNQTNGPGWLFKDHWLVAGHPVSWWYGVEIHDNRVIRLDMSDNMLNGHIPGEIGDLDSLRYLDFCHAVLLSLPNSIGDLSTLDTLSLFSVEIDTLPQGIGNLHDLKYFNFSFTQIRYLPDEIGGLINLEVLSGYDSELRAIPETIGNLAAIRVIDLALNDIGNLPQSIGNCTNLVELWLNANQIPSVPVEIGNLTNLKKLILGGNCLTVLPEEIFTLTNLEFLNFAANSLNGPIPASIGNLIHLTNLQFFKNEFTSIPDEIGNLVNLRWIYAYSNRIDALPLTLLNCTEILAFNMGENALTFDDIEPLVSISNEFHYYSQDSISESRDTIISLNTPFRLECLTGGEFNHYQWLKDDDTLAGATDYYLEWAAVTYQDSGSYRCIVTNTLATGLTLYSRATHLHVKDLLGANDLPPDEVQFNLYPNPAKSKLFISTKEKAGTIYLYAINGLLMRKISIEDNLAEIDIADLNSGIYLVRFVSGSSVEVRKVIFQQP